MADEKISQLSDAGAPQASDQFVIARTGSSLSMLWSAILSASGAVSSVFGRTGAVTAQTGDYTAAQVGALPSTETLDQIATANVTAANWSNNSHKITSLANGAGAQDAAAFGQIPTALPPNGSAGGDLTGTYPNPTIANVAQMTTKGDLLVGHGSNVSNRLGVGSDTFVLTADSAQTNGVKWAAASGGAAVTYAIHQVAHGFSVGSVVGLSGTSYVAAKADSAADAEVSGIVSAVAGADDFTLQAAGKVTGLSGLTAGTVYFLSDSSAGALTATEPSTITHVSKPLLYADTTTSGYFYNYRGEVISGTTYPPGYEIGYDEITAGVNITGTSAAAATTIITCGAHTFDGAPVLVTFFTPQLAYPTAALSNAVGIDLWEGATNLGELSFTRTDQTANQDFKTICAMWRFTPSAASHTYLLKAYVSSTTGTPAVGAGSGGVATSVPAFVRFTKV